MPSTAMPPSSPSRRSCGCSRWPARRADPRRLRAGRGRHRRRARRQRRHLRSERQRRAPHADDRLRHLQPAQPGHQGPGLARAELGGRASRWSWVQSAGCNKANESLRDGQHRRRLDGGLRRAAGPFQRLADQDHRHLSPAGVVGDRRREGLDDHGRRGAAGQVRRRHQGHRPLLLPAPGARGGGAEHQRRQGAEPAARRRPRGAGCRQRRRLGRARPDHGRGAGRERRRAHLPNIDFNSYGFLNAREDFLAENPDLAQAVVERLREGARRGSRRTRTPPSRCSPRWPGIDPAVATTTLRAHEARHRPRAGGDADRGAREDRPVFVGTATCPSQGAVDTALSSLFDDQLRPAGGPLVTEASMLHGRSAEAMGLGGSGDPSSPRAKRSTPAAAGVAARRRPSSWWGAVLPLALLGLWQALVVRAGLPGRPSCRRRRRSSAPPSTSGSAACSSSTWRSPPSGSSWGSRSAPSWGWRSVRSSGSRAGPTPWWVPRSAVCALCPPWRGCRCC